MKILIFEWRDLKNPSSGGSEIYFHELAKRWVTHGNDVAIISGGWKGCLKQENIDGIKIIRTGSAFTIYLKAPLEYLSMKDKPDIIIDVENGIPFFTPLFSKKRKILHIHHVHKDVWFKELPLPFALAGWFIETKLMPLIYGNEKIITISESSAEEIKKEHFGNVFGIVNPGIEFCKYKQFEKNKKPTILFLNRIKKYKGIKVLLDAVEELNKNSEDVEVLIAGSGDNIEEMKTYAIDKKLNNVHFLGRISEETKRELMQKAWIFINPSFKEGWGIVNIEASYFGLPVIGSRVSGIKDSIEDRKTGLLFEYGNHIELSQKISLLLNEKKLRNSMEKESPKWAKKFDWDSKALQYLNLLKNSL